MGKLLKGQGTEAEGFPGLFPQLSQQQLRLLHLYHLQEVKVWLCKLHMQETQAEARDLSMKM